MQETSATSAVETAEGHRPAPLRDERGRLLAVAGWLAVVASYLAVVFAYAVPQDFRDESPFYVRLAWTAFMIRTFLFHAGMPWCLIAAVAVWIRRRRLLLATIPLLLLAFGPALWSYVPKRQVTVSGEPITVMSVNLLAGNHETAPIVAEVLAARPDVLLLQEYAPQWHAAFQQALAADYPHVRHVIRSDSFGLAIYSRHPFAEPVDMALPLADSATPQARAVVRIDDRRVAFYNVHLMPPRGRRYTTVQRREFADLLEHLRREELPIVLSGDFNFTGRSPFAVELARLGLTDTHDLSGSGRGSTWPVLGKLRYVPGIRIDHIYLSGELTSPSSRVGTGLGSDHRPIVAEIGFRAD